MASQVFVHKTCWDGSMFESNYVVMVTSYASIYKTFTSHAVGIGTNLQHWLKCICYFSEWKGESDATKGIRKRTMLSL